MPYGEFSPVRLEASLVAPLPSATVPGCVCCRTYVPFRFWISVQAYRIAAVPAGPWLSAVYHPRTCNRYYGLIRQSDELRPAWASSAYSGRSLPLRAVRLTFPSLLCHTIGSCMPRPLPRRLTEFT